MRLIIAGSRTFNDKKLLEKEVDSFIEEMWNGVSIANTQWDEDWVVVSGTCEGADLHGEWYADKNGLELKRFAPDWKKFGKAAGPKRNTEMAEYASQSKRGACIVFDRGGPGSANMIKQAKEYGLILKVIQV